MVKGKKAWVVLLVLLVAFVPLLNSVVGQAEAETTEQGSTVDEMQNENIGENDEATAEQVSDEDDEVVSEEAEGQSICSEEAKKLDKKMQQAKHLSEVAQKKVTKALDKIDQIIAQHPQLETLLQNAAQYEAELNYGQAMKQVQAAFKQAAHSQQLFAKLGQLMRKAQQCGVEVDELPVFVNGQTVEFDTKPEIVAARTMVPVRRIAEALGATVTWDSQNQQVVISKDEQTVSFAPGDKTVYVNGEAVELASAVYLNCKRTMVPLRLISEALGTEVYWDNTSKMISICEETVEGE